jgi:acylphosphatase
MPTVSILVSGRVQGVWFRKYTLEKAIELGITGTVRNLRSGDVQIEASGSEEQLKALVTWCWSGSPESKVTDVQVMPLDNFRANTFSIVE